MPEKISTALDEFYKIYGFFCLVLISVFFGFEISNNFDLIFFVLFFVLMSIITFDFWRMKKVEMTDAGLIITKRFFFSETTIFVSYENVESVTNKFWWLGNNARTSIKFIEETEFGNEIVFDAKGFSYRSRSQILQKLKLAVAQNKKAERLNSNFLKNNLLED